LACASRGVFAGFDFIDRARRCVAGDSGAGSFGIRSPFFAYALLALVALIPTVLLAGDTPRRVPAAGSANRTNLLDALREIVKPRLAYFGIALFAGLTRGPFFADLFHLYAAYTYHLKPAQIGYLATAAACTALPLPGFLGVACSMSALAASAFLHLNIYWYVAFFLLAAITQSLTSGSVQTIGADVAQPQARGTFLGFWQFTGQGGQTLGPIAFAFLANTVSSGAAFCL
jgi:hypothetical protein